MYAFQLKNLWKHGYMLTGYDKERRVYLFEHTGI
jgi:hypothetical protein